MGYWLKSFADGTNMQGTDEAVAAGKASWSRTSLRNMVGAQIQHNGFTIEIFGPGNYWQSDTYETQVLGRWSTMTKRRIMRYIEPSDKYISCVFKPLITKVHFNLDQPGAKKNVVIKPDWYGQWLILEYDIKQRKATFFIKENKF